MLPSSGDRGLSAALSRLFARNTATVTGPRDRAGDALEPPAPNPICEKPRYRPVTLVSPEPGGVGTARAVSTDAPATAPRRVDMTHATPRPRHGGRPGPITTNLPASAPRKRGMGVWVGERVGWGQGCEGGGTGVGGVRSCGMVGSRW